MRIDPKNLIVCYRDKQTPGQKVLGMLLQVLFWGVLLYVLCAFLALCCWFIDYAPFESMIDKRDIQAIKAVVSRYFPLIGGFVCAFLLWALYNWLRFHGHRDRRRTRPAPVSLEETAEFYRMKSDEVRNIRHAKIMTCLFDDNGNIIGVEHDAAAPLAKEERGDVEMPAAEKDAVRDKELCA